MYLPSLTNHLCARIPVRTLPSSCSKMPRGSFAERILFADDMMMYFMKKYHVKWTPGTNCEVWDGHSRRFTEAMGAVAWNLAHEDWTFDIDEKNKPALLNFYNPQDFLYYCGLVAYISVQECINGEDNYADGVVPTIVTYLGEITEDGSFLSSGGWYVLEKYADEMLNYYQRAGGYADWILFAEDIMMYFMKRFQVEWTPSTNYNVWDGHPRRFTEAMGSVAWHLVYEKWAFKIDKNKKPTFSNGYNPKDFLHYCGVVVFASVCKYINGDHKYVDGVLFAIVTYLADINQDGSFRASGGWDVLAKSARKNQYCLLWQLGYRIQSRQTNTTQAMQQENETQMEMQCIGTLLQNL